MKKLPLLFLMIMIVSCASVRKSTEPNVEIYYISKHVYTLEPYSPAMLESSGIAVKKNMLISESEYENEIKMLMESAIPVDSHEVLIIERNDNASGSSMYDYEIRKETVPITDTSINARLSLIYMFDDKITHISLGMDPTLVMVNGSYFNIDENLSLEIWDYLIEKYSLKY